jgi:para-aminobenzoate synthetase component 1
MHADCVLSQSGHPAETQSVIGVRPLAELHIVGTTTKTDVKRFCFDASGIVMGYFSYDYGMLLRGVSSRKARDFPLGHLKKYSAVILFDAEKSQLSVEGNDASLHASLVQTIKQMPDVLPPQQVAGLPTSAPAVSLGQVEYEAGVRETLERILSGYTYQLNLSTQFEWVCPDLDPLALFLALRRGHPAPFYSWLSTGQHRIIATAPERFLRVLGGHVLSQPIKGTLHCEFYTPELAAKLTQSAKESAELSMIVDLVRNDISANCLPGTVHVMNHKSIFAVDNLLQMYSDVCGELRPDRDCLDLFFDAFPGGSITGCPKISSMEIIETLEPHARGVYCGSVVVIRDERTMDSSIAIRTGVFDTLKKTLRTYAGSGIVVDSEPTSEYQETMAKAEKFLTLGDR